MHQPSDEIPTKSNCMQSDARGHGFATAFRNKKAKSYYFVTVVVIVVVVKFDIFV